MRVPSTSGLSVELLLQVINVKYGCFTFTLLTTAVCAEPNALMMIIQNLQFFTLKASCACLYEEEKMAE